TSPGRQMNRDEPAPADLREQEVPTTYESWAGRSEGDDVWVQCGSYKKFTGGNFPHNPGVRAGTGNISSPKDYHAHHNLPQKFQGYFSSRGLNIHNPKYGSWVWSSKHLADARRFNAHWEWFRTTYPHASMYQIEQYGRFLAREFGYRIYF
ncbi:hypothetical protein, partial [Kytococcus schroeteri]|uniref:hypothetical protein n=1 Tax=Kytococcus schroeteri TaxID=138300 RepID=UPI001EE2C163